jgi:hypothetical protein
MRAVPYTLRHKEFDALHMHSRRPEGSAQTAVYSLGLLPLSLFKQLLLKFWVLCPAEEASFAGIFYMLLYVKP